MSTQTSSDGEIQKPNDIPTPSDPLTDDLEAQRFYGEPQGTHPHDHFSGRAPWLRAGVLGANDGGGKADEHYRVEPHDIRTTKSSKLATSCSNAVGDKRLTSEQVCGAGLVSTASLMMGVGGGTDKQSTLVLAGAAGLVGGALSMAVGEFISVYSQKDAELADVEREREEQAKGVLNDKGPEAQLKEMRELAEIYCDRGLSRPLAKQVAEELSEKDVIRAHARDELGIDLDDLSNPYKAALSSGIAFVIGAGVPLLAAAFISDHVKRIISLLVASTAALVAFGAIGAWLGGAKKLVPAGRVLLGGWAAMGITYGFGALFALIDKS